MFFDTRQTEPVTDFPPMVAPGTYVAIVKDLITETCGSGRPCLAAYLTPVGDEREPLGEARSCPKMQFFLNESGGFDTSIWGGAGKWQKFCRCLEIPEGESVPKDDFLWCPLCVEVVKKVAKNKKGEEIEFSSINKFQAATVRQKEIAKAFIMAQQGT